MLDRRNADLALDQRGGQLGIAHIPWAGLDLNRFGQINSSEHNACIGRRRAQGNLDLIAGVQTDARCPNGVFQGSLPNHVRSPNTSIELEHGKRPVRTRIARSMINRQSYNTIGYRR